MMSKRNLAASLLLVVPTLSACQDPTEPTDRLPFSLEVAYSFPMLEAGDFIKRFEFESTGELWVATFEGAVIRVAEGDTTVFDVDADLGGQSTGSLFIDVLDRVWVPLGNGFAVHQDGVWTRHDPPDVLTPGTSVRQVAVNASGDILLAAGNASGGGLLLRRADTWSALTPQNSSLPSSISHSLAVAENGDFWIGSAIWQGGQGGLSRIADGILELVGNTSSGLLYNSVDAIAVAGEEIYLGYHVPERDVVGPDGGLQILSTTDGRLTSSFPYMTGLTSNRVRSLVYTKHDELWFTTGLDEGRPGCEICVVGVGHVDAAGEFRILSWVNYNELAPNEYLPWITDDSAGNVYVARADRGEIWRVIQ